MELRIDRERTGVTSHMRPAAGRKRPWRISAERTFPPARRRRPYRMQREFRWASPLEMVRGGVPSLLDRGIDPFEHELPLTGLPEAARSTVRPMSGSPTNSSRTSLASAWRTDEATCGEIIPRSKRRSSRSPYIPQWQVSLRFLSRRPRENR